MYLTNSGWPQPNPVPNGNFTGIAPHASSHIPVIGMAWPAWMTDERVSRGSKKKMVMRSRVSEADGGIGEEGFWRSWRSSNEETRAQ